MKKFDNIIISSRVRLARNIEEVPFDHRSNHSGIYGKVLDAVSKTIIKYNPTYTLLFMRNLTSADSVVLFEQHLISMELLKNKQSGAVIVSPEKNISIMLNEEDHIRIQAILPKSNLVACYNMASKIDKQICSENRVAFDFELGFLTSCPTNLGTSMRASIMLFLPALSKCGKIGEIADLVASMHLTIRGVYGEGSEGEGYIYQVSNQASLGYTEKSIIDTVNDIVRQICEYELELQEEMFLEDEYKMTNDIYRAFAYLSTCNMLSTEEAVENNALVKLGVSLDILTFENPHFIDEIFVKVQPAFIVQQDYSAQEIQTRDRIRASLVKSLLMLAKRI